MIEKKWVVGIWKFSDKISVEELGKVAQEWADKDANYLQLYIRKVSRDQWGIGFMYRLPEEGDARAAYDEYFDNATDYLKRKFGNGLAGWDISSTAWVVKDGNI